MFRSASLPEGDIANEFYFPTPLSQASACDGNLYSIYHNYQKAQPHTISLN